MLCLHFKNLGSKYLDSSLYIQSGAPRDPNLQARLQEVLFFSSAWDPIFERQGELGALTSSLAHQQTGAPCPLWPSSGTGAPSREVRYRRQEVRPGSWKRRKMVPLWPLANYLGTASRAMNLLQEYFWVCSVNVCLCTYQQQATNLEISTLSFVLIRALATLSPSLLSSFFFLEMWQPLLRTRYLAIKGGDMGKHLNFFQLV